jgi:hypothetical protein
MRESVIDAYGRAIIAVRRVIFIRTVSSLGIGPRLSLSNEAERSEQFHDASRDRQARGQARRFYAEQVDQPSDPVFVLSLD